MDDVPPLAAKVIVATDLTFFAVTVNVLRGFKSIEKVGSNEGLGSAIINGAQYNTFQPAYLWATIIAAAMLELVFYGVIALVERRVVKWETVE